MKTQSYHMRRSTRFITKDKETWVLAQNIKVRNPQLQHKNLTQLRNQR